MNTMLLVILAFFAAATTAVVGMGGGMMVISVMPGLVPTEAIVPLHAVIQFASNGSRLLFDIKSVNWRIALQWFIGAVIGAAAGSQLVLKMPVHYLPVFLGVFILLFIWTPPGKLHIRLPGKFASLGALVAFLSMFVGATGPLGLTMLLREDLTPSGVIATSGAMNGSLQLTKTIAFILIGFAFGPYLGLLAAVIASVSLGSLAGKMIRSRIPENKFRSAVKILLTILALRMAIRAFI